MLAEDDSSDLGPYGAPVVYPNERELHMTLARYMRWSGPICIAAGLLAVATLVLFVVVVGSDTISDAATSPSFYAPTVVALSSTVLLRAGLIGLFIRQAGELKTLGLVGFVTGGGRDRAGRRRPMDLRLRPAIPRREGSRPGGRLVGLGGGRVPALLPGHGGRLAAVRRRHPPDPGLPRWVVVLLIVGAIVTVLPLPSRTLLLGIAVACLGYVLARPARSAARPDPGVQTA